jgi:hypothetical protein
MSAMTADVRERILGLLSAGPATVARLAAGLGLPGGVVSYELKLLERDGLIRVGTTRVDRGVATPVYVSTVAAAPPPLPVPAPLPGLTWTEDAAYPTPLWTVPTPIESDAAPSLQPAPAATEQDRAPQPDPAAQAVPYPGEPFPEAGASSLPGAAGSAPSGERDSTYPGPSTGYAERPAGSSPEAPPPSYADLPARSGARTGAPGPRPQRPRAAPAIESPRGPRLREVRRVPMDDATFYEFAARLDALAREFAARATPGAPPTELTIQLSRPETTGYGS